MSTFLHCLLRPKAFQNPHALKDSLIVTLFSKWNEFMFHLGTIHNLRFATFEVTILYLPEGIKVHWQGRAGQEWVGK